MLSAALLFKDTHTHTWNSSAAAVTKPAAVRAKPPTLRVLSRLHKKNTFFFNDRKDQVNFCVFFLVHFSHQQIKVERSLKPSPWGAAGIDVGLQQIEDLGDPVSHLLCLRATHLIVKKTGSILVAHVLEG